MSNEDESQYIEFYRQKLERICIDRQNGMSEINKKKLEMISENKKIHKFIELLRRNYEKISNISQKNIILSDESMELLNLKNQNEIYNQKDIEIRKKLLETFSKCENNSNDLLDKKGGIIFKLVDKMKLFDKLVMDENQNMFISVNDYVFIFNLEQEFN